MLLATVAFLQSVSSYVSRKKKERNLGEIKSSNFISTGSCSCLICVYTLFTLQAPCGHLPEAEISINKSHTHTCKPKNTTRSSSTEAVMHVRFREDANQWKWPQQRWPFPVLSVMALNGPVKEIDAKSESLVGGKTKEGGFLQSYLPEFYHHPPSTLTFPPHTYFCLSMATWERLSCLPLLQAALTTQDFHGKKRSCLFLSTSWICQMSTVPRNSNHLKTVLDY